MAAQVVAVSVVRGSPYLDCLGGGIPAHRESCEVLVDWLSATGGGVSAAIASTYSSAMVTKHNMPQPVSLRGYIKRVVTDPDGGGAAPTDGYDITLLDKDSYDVAGSGLMDRSTDTNEEWEPDTPVWVDGEITFTVAGAGDENGGTCRIYMVYE